MKKVRKILLVALLSIIAVVLLVWLLLALASPGKLEPLKNGRGEVIEGALSEKLWVEVGGIPQGMFIRSENIDNPVILFLHGGPGSPELPMILPQEQEERLEKYFTVCYWDQRGAGMTYSKATDPASLNVGTMVEDTREVTEYLKQRFNQAKIYLMGHSWGSYLGVKTISKYPELYHAYIGIGQVTDQLESERLAWNYMHAYALESGDTKAVKELEKFDKYAAGFPTKEYLMGARISYMNKYGVGVMHENFSMTDFLKDIVFFKGYTLSEKLSYARGSMFSLDNAFFQIIGDSLFDTVNEFSIPVYVIQGKYDYQTSYKLAKEYVELISVPQKEFYTFENSAHSPNIEEPEKFVNTIKHIADISR